MKAASFCLVMGALSLLVTGWQAPAETTDGCEAKGDPIDISIGPFDPVLASCDPDEYAWRLFAVLNSPHDPSSGFGEPGEVVWERWANGRLLFGEGEPPSWDDAVNRSMRMNRSRQQQIADGLVREFELEAACRGETSVFREGPRNATQPQVAPLSREEACRQLEEMREFGFSSTDDGVDPAHGFEEVRLNRAAWEHILENKLYLKKVQEALFYCGKYPPFPLKAKVIKANWIRLDLENPAPEGLDRASYHTVEMGGAHYGLVALSIATRDLPRWHWSTFEHADNEIFWPGRNTKLENSQHFAGWVIPSRDSYSCRGSNSLSCNQFPDQDLLDQLSFDRKVEGGTAPVPVSVSASKKWEHYRLRGTQIDWVDDQGNPTRLVNSKIEGGFDQKSMSCMTCHALAATDSPRPANFDQSFCEDPIQAASAAAGSGIQGDVDERVRIRPFRGLNEARRAIGSVGVPDASRFVLDERLCRPEGDELTDCRPTGKYHQLSFLWILTRAK